MARKDCRGTSKDEIVVRPLEQFERSLEWCQWKQFQFSDLERSDVVASPAVQWPDEVAVVGNRDRLAE